MLEEIWNIFTSLSIDLITKNIYYQLSGCITIDDVKSCLEDNSKFMYIPPLYVYMTNTFNILNIITTKGFN